MNKFVLILSVMIVGAGLLAVAVPAMSADDPVPAPKTPENDKTKLVKAALKQVGVDLEAGFRLGREGLDLHGKKNYLAAGWKYIEAIKKNPNDANATYNLACALSLLGETEPSAVCLEHAIRLGFQDYSHILRDTDFEPVRHSDRFKELFGKLTQLRQNEIGLPGSDHSVLAPTLQRYRVTLPPGYDEVTPYPVIVALHGPGSNLEQFSSAVSSLSQTNAILVVPTAPYPVPVSGNRLGYSWFTSANNDADEREQNLVLQSTQASVLYLEAIVKDLKQKYAIDKERTYIFGFSQGGYMAYAASLNGKALFSGAIICSGWMPPTVNQNGLAASKKVKFFIAHGTEDKMIPLQLGEKAAHGLINSGIAVSFFATEGGHELTPDLLNAVAKWINEN